MVLFHDNACLHTANLTRENLKTMHWNTLSIILTYPSVIITCLDLSKKKMNDFLGDQRFGNDTAVDVSRYARNFMMAGKNCGEICEENVF